MKRVYVLLLFGLLCLLTACQNSSKPTLKVAATSIPHAEILEWIKPDLKDKGIDLEVIVVEDYNIPNRALQDKEVDANFFQHDPFLELQNKEFGYHLENLAAIHLEPMALYSKKLESLRDLQPHSSIAIPSDPSNQARALALLETLGLIKLNQHDSKTSLMNIRENPHGFKFIEIDSPLLSRALDDIQLAAITTNFALQAGLSPKKDALAQEAADSLFVNILVIRAGESQRKDLQVLKEALTSHKVRHFIEDHYQGAVIPAF